MIYVIQDKKIRKQLEKLPLDIKRLYLKFLKDIQTKNDKITTLKTKGYKDHQLKGKWRGYRALRLNKYYRVYIELIKKKKIMIIDL